MRISLEFTAGAKANQRASIKPKPNPLAEPEITNLANQGENTSYG
jgi:hypothetical protein